MNDGFASDIHALSGAYAIDALDEAERAEFERHLAGCPACRHEVDELSETSALLAEIAPVTPSDDLRSRVMAGIATVRPLPPLPDQETATSSVPAATQLAPEEGAASRVVVPISRRRRFAPLLAAAAVAAVIGVGATVWQPWEDETSQAPALTAVDRVLAADDAERYTQTFPDGAEATLVRSKELNQAVLLTEDMPPPPDGKVYELWLDHEGVGMVAAGLMESGEDQLVLEGNPATAIGAGITVEPAGGSDQPTSAPVALFAFDA